MTSPDPDGPDTYVWPFVAKALEKYGRRFAGDAQEREQAGEHGHAAGLYEAAAVLTGAARELLVAVEKKRRAQVETLTALAAQNERRFGSYPGAIDETELS